MNGRNAFYCFELDDQAVVHEKIEPGALGSTTFKSFE
jgi:hypothetical protein